MAFSDRKSPPPPPPPPPPKWPDRGDIADEVELPIPDILVGQWVTSYSGWMHFDPRQKPAQPGSPTPPPLPPQMACMGYDPDTDKFFEREGYFVFAALASYRFNGFGKLFGVTHTNRGGIGHVRNDDIEGTYTLGLNSLLNIYEGTFNTVHTNIGGSRVEYNYSFIMKTRDEMEWVWTAGNYRAFVTRGTMTRIRTP